MKVSAWPASKKDLEMEVGIAISKKDRNEYFDPDWDRVVIDMDGVEEIFKLRPAFWRSCNEIPDNSNHAIRTWMLQHGFLFHGQ